jgi:hypothetical protein
MLPDGGSASNHHRVHGHDYPCYLLGWERVVELATSPQLGLVPNPRTPLFGKDSELDAAQVFLCADAVPLLTLTGPRSVGKARLAIATAHAVADAFAGGARFVSLASVQHADYVPFTVARSLGPLDARGAAPLTQLAMLPDGLDLTTARGSVGPRVVRTVSSMVRQAASSSNRTWENN